MHQILVYGDPLSWGIVPDTRERLPFRVRWPGVMERAQIQEAPAKCAGLAIEYQRVAAEEAVSFFDVASVVQSSVVDEVHLDADQHSLLGHALAGVVRPLFQEKIR